MLRDFPTLGPPQRRRADTSDTAQLEAAVTSPVPVAPASTDDAWVEKHDLAAGKTHFLNSRTRETSSAKPAIVAATPPRLAAPTVGHDVSEPTTAREAWCEERDPASGRPYWVNTATKTSTWVDPISSAEASKVRCQLSCVSCRSALALTHCLAQATIHSRNPIHQAGIDLEIEAHEGISDPQEGKSYYARNHEAFENPVAGESDNSSRSRLVRMRLFSLITFCIRF